MIETARKEPAMPETKKKAFTLIELLVVIAIIAVLMGILMPALRKVREQARAQACMANIRSVGLAMLLHLEGNDYRMPDFYTHTGNSNGHLWYQADGTTMLRPEDNHSYWGINYYPYVKEIKVFGCPSFKNWSDQLANEMLYDEGEIQNSAFSMNGWLSKVKTIAVKHQGEVIVAHDHVEPRIENKNDMLYAESNGMNLSAYRENGNRSQYYRGIFRHSVSKNKDFETGGRLNCLWLDGHVTAIKETMGTEIRKSYYDPLGKN
jgi:prepilin-type N-terminal cleavage/methylation domain-containing protein/prepilin-type processing-associated H-X9-DG protein